MQNRHKVPNVFTLYMVDVLCCALGCVILLWFLKFNEAKRNLRDAEQQRLSSQKTSDLLASTQLERDELNRVMADIQTRMVAAEKEVNKLRSDLNAARSRAETAEKDLEQTRRAHDTVLAKGADLEKSLASLQTQFAGAEDRLNKKTKEQQSLSKDLAGVKERTSALETLLREKEALARATAKSADSLADRLRDADARSRLSQEKLASLQTRAQSLEKDLTAKEKELAGSGKSMAVLDEYNRNLLKEIESRDAKLAAANRSIDALQSEKKSLADRAFQVKVATENRFEGITLTGRKVIFLVDISGSMELVDEKTPAPKKWAGVGETLAKLMRSLPQLEKFQVILFSEKVSYLMGNDGNWLDYQPRTTVDQVTKALAAIKPRGPTNMYLALENAFKFRASGLDTIYVLSDGLPNVGPGLSTEQTRKLKEVERTDILSHHVRKTLKADWNRDTAAAPKVRINTIGFFYESPDLGSFLWALARDNDGGFVGMSKP